MSLKAVGEASLFVLFAFLRLKTGKNNSASACFSFKILPATTGLCFFFHLLPTVFSTRALIPSPAASALPPTRFIGMKFKAVTFIDSSFLNCYFEDVSSVGSSFNNCTIVDSFFYNTGERTHRSLLPYPNCTRARRGVSCRGTGGEKKKKILLHRRCLAHKSHSVSR